MTQLRSLRDYTRPSVEPALDAADPGDAAEASRRDSRPVSSLLAKLPRLPVALRKGVRVIRADENAEVYDAEQALEAAKAATRKLTGQISTATEQGREEGYAAGRNAANEELAEEIHRVQQQLAAWQDEARTTIVDLAIKVAGKIIGEHDVDQTTRNAIVANAQKHMNDGPYTLQVAPDMLRTARDALRTLEIEYPSVPLPSVRLDARLDDGRALLVTRFGSVDLDVHSQLEAIKRTLLARSSDAQSAGA
jgi:flagellar biosynthesis/type III secretory pathway protein FliH